MIRALLDGRKTVTRRIVKPMSGKQREWLTDDLIQRVPHGHMSHGGWQMHHPKAGKLIDCVGVRNEDGIREPHDSPLGWIRCPYGTVGDRLWCKETWCGAFDATLRNGVCYAADRAFRTTAQRATGTLFNVNWNGQSPQVFTWRPSIHMPRWASRITLEVTGVRVERLQSITKEDARAEGVKPFPADPEGDCWTDGKHRTAFEYLWGQINGFDGDPKARGTWASNPWVWCVAFRRLP